MRKSNNYFKFLEYVTCGKVHDSTIDKGNGVLECKSYVSISDIEDRYKTTFGLENEWLTLKNILIDEDILYVYYLEGENSKLVAVYLLDNFKTQKELKDSITTACDEFLHEVLLEKSDVREDKDCPDFCEEDCIENAECESVHKQMKAINNPNWHTVRLATVNSSDFFRINEKLKLYILAYRELKQTISYLRKCKTIDTYDTCFIRYIKRINVIYANGKISNAMFNFIKVKLSMQNVESGVWSSDCEDATGYCKSRRYNKSRLRR